MLHKIENGGSVIYTGDRGYDEYLKILDEEIKKQLKDNVEKQIKKAIEDDKNSNR